MAGFSNKRNRTLCAIQMSHTDVIGTGEADNCIRAVKASALFDEVAIVAPDLPENAKLKSIAAEYGVDLFTGPVMNVTERMLSAARAYDCEVITRVLYNWFFVDMALVGNMLGHLTRGGYDLLQLPRNFDVRFGGDVFTRGFLEKVSERFALDKKVEEEYMFNPWGYAESFPEQFDIGVFGDIPTYGEDYFNEIRIHMARVWPERWDGAYSPTFAYELPKRFLPEESVVLDLACGTGAGTACLAKRFARVVGVDLSGEVVDAATGSYAAQYDNLGFYAAPYEEIGFDYKFDAIISIHTMEHIRSDDDFLEKCSELMKPGGLLFLEVPLLMRYPFADVDTPLAPHHVREYDIVSLDGLLKRHFEVVEGYGVNRGYYMGLERARNAALYVARNN